MTSIVENTKQFENFLIEYNKHDSLLIPIFCDDKIHPLSNELCFLYVVILSDDISKFVLNFKHLDALQLDSLLLADLNNLNYKFILDKKKFTHIISYENLIDINVLNYLLYNTSVDIELDNFFVYSFFDRKFHDYKNVNNIIPLVKWVESLDKQSDILLEYIYKYKHLINTSEFNFINNLTIDVFSEIEKSGIYIDRKKFNKYFSHKVNKQLEGDVNNGVLYTEHNILTLTGRPSSRFGKINFSALNKDDGSREFIISRFGDGGGLLAYDFDSYHLRLIGSIVDYKFPDGNVHEYLGKQYFNTEHISEQQYNESKKITFQNLYGGVSQEYENIPFFNKVTSLINLLWDDFIKVGYLESPLSKRKFYFRNFVDMYPQMLFNYFIQMLETERNVVVLNKLLSFMKDYKSKLVLYVYDSFLIDFCAEDGKDFIYNVKNILEDGDFPTKIYLGNNFHNLENITNLL